VLLSARKDAGRQVIACSGITCGGGVAIPLKNGRPAGDKVRAGCGL
jgi:hypothetical protein